MNKGVGGFRFDVVNLISKAQFIDDPHGGDGRMFYTDGPRIHEFLAELNRETFGKNPEIITVGEMSSTSMENCFRYASEDGSELSMTFSFHHLKVDFMGNEKWVLVPTDFEKLKHILFSWQEQMAQAHAWNALFWCNHDQPRVVSRFGDETTFHQESAKMLATLIHCMRGTPYIYQGEELGMTNAHFSSLEQYRDVESINHFHLLRDKGMDEHSVHAILRAHSRDNSRTPMQWTSTTHGGFTTGTPWIEVNPNSNTINAQSQIDDAHSILAHYKKLIQMRKQYHVIQDGGIKALTPDHASVIAYERKDAHTSLVCINNFFRKSCTWQSPIPLHNYQILLSNYPDSDIQDCITLRPYESLVLICDTLS